MKKPRIFIGSSSEALDREIVSDVVQLIQEFSEPYDWSQTFNPNDITIESIIDQSRQSDFGLFVFCKDDSGTSRDTEFDFPRDNVILEAGIFVGELGRDRVFILLEDGVKTPSDFLGITLSTFKSSDNPTIRKSSLKTEFGKIKRQVEQLGGRDTLFPEWKLPEPEGLFGLSQVIELDYERVRDKFKQIHTYTVKNTPITPLGFHSNVSCVKAYVGGLAKVRDRYWTTTSLTSAFWTQTNEVDVMAANLDLMENLDKNNGEARRLFLLDLNLDLHIQLLKDTIASFRNKGKVSKIEKRLSEFNKLRKNIEKQIQDGCEVKGYYDEDKAFSELPKEMGFDPADSEIAIYDNHRIDVFKSGSSGELIEVTSFTELTNNYKVYRDNTIAYFDDCWEESESIIEILDRIEDAMDHAIKRIDYRSSWLSFYEQDMDEKDANLKTLEIGRVEEILKEEKRWGNINRFLDIGTCTGRYPLAIRDGVAGDGYILGIDDDKDCVDFTESKIRKVCGGVWDERIHIERADFVSKKQPEVLSAHKHDLITCMLGTLSHFGERRIANNEAIELAIERMSDMLDDHGLLFISNWSKKAAQEGNLLSIYSDENKMRLAEWTPAKRYLIRLFGKYGLAIKIQATIGDRLEFYCLEKKSNKTNSADGKKRRR